MRLNSSSKKCGNSISTPRCGRSLDLLASDHLEHLTGKATWSWPFSWTQQEKKCHQPPLMLMEDFDAFLTNHLKMGSRGLKKTHIWRRTLETRNYIWRNLESQHFCKSPWGSCKKNLWRFWWTSNRISGASQHFLKVICGPVFVYNVGKTEAQNKNRFRFM